VKFVYTICTIPFVFLSSQDFPTSWSQSYGVYDVANVHECGHYSLGFSLNNYCIYQQQGEHVGDTISYDERRFDIFAKIGVFKNAEFEIKYSHPTSGILSLKYQFLSSFIDGALKFGCGYMKGTRVGKITDYVFDVYPILIFSKDLFKGVKIFLAPKIIYSIHLKDRQEPSDREPRYIFQYGYGLGLSLGDRFSLMPETNWLFGNDEGKLYTVHQFGVGVTARIH
jgi:hypothetical protein